MAAHLPEVFYPTYGFPFAFAAFTKLDRKSRHACPEIDGAYSPDMIQTVEAIVDERGAVRLLEPVQLDRRHRALVTILADEPSEAHETALLSVASLAQDWNRPEEDAAWSHLQQAR